MSLIASDHFRIVVGLGKSGMSLVRFLAQRGVSFAVADTRENPPELATLRRDYPQVEVRCGELDVDFLCRADELYVSPGLALATPALQAAAARGVKLSGDIDLFARNAKAPIVAISGSNAKSTVTTLVGEMAAAAGKRVAVGGNLGTPALDLLSDDIELYVMELSSFQLETTNQLGAEDVEPREPGHPGMPRPGVCAADRRQLPGHGVSHRAAPGARGHARPVGTRDG